MVNEVSQGLFLQAVAVARRLMLGAACVATLVSCGGGQGDGAAGSASPVPATGTDSTAAAVTDSACDATIVLNTPRNLGASNRIELSWQAQGGVTSFSVLVQRAAGQTFEPVDAVVAGQSAQFSRGAAYRLDFPTARVRVRGCNGAKQCVDSNEQPLLDVLLGTVVELPPPSAGIDNVGSSVVLSADGNTLAVEGIAVGVVIDGMAAGVATDRLHLFDRDAQGRWALRQVLQPSACTGFAAGSTTLDSTGTTLAVSSLRLEGCAPQSGAIEVFARSDTQWQRAALITDEPPRIDQRFGALSLADDGRTLAALASGRARVYDRDDGGRWTLAAEFVADPGVGPSSGFGIPRLSGNGAVLAVQGVREVPRPQNPSAPPQPDSYIALFTREPAGWIARTTVRSTKPQDCCVLRRDNDLFGTSLALDHDGSTLAVGAPGDNSGASDMIGDPGDFGSRDSGAVWIFRRTGDAVWSRQAFVKAPFTPEGGNSVDFLGTSVALDRDGRVLAATALGQSQPAGVNRNHAADRVPVIVPSTDGGGSSGGAAYVFVRDDSDHWTQRTTVFPPLEPRTLEVNFTFFSMAFAANTATLVLGVAVDGPPTVTSVFVY